MEFLKNIVLPQPIEHFHLLLFMLNLVFILFLPYLGLALGSALLSLVHHRRHRKGGKNGEKVFARFFIEIPFATTGVPLFFGIVPALALLFLFAQLLQGTGAIAPGLMTFGFLALTAATAFLYVYRYNLRLQDALAPSQAGSAGAELRSHAAETADRAGRWGLGFLILASVLCVGATSIAVNRGSWEGVQSFAGLLLHPDFWVRYLQFLALAAGMTGLGALFFATAQQGGTALDPEHRAHLTAAGLQLSSVSLVVSPLMLLATQALLPEASLTGAIFGLAGAHLVFLLLTGIFLYAFHRDGKNVYVTYAFFAFCVGLVLLFTRDQIAVRNATQDHAASLSIAAERELISLRSAIGIGAKPLSGQEIFDAKCSACHQFDQKKVGPPYNTVLPKYAGKKDELVKFILNPRKIDPAYPSMPGQGLRPAEGDSIAAYLLARIVSGKGG